jgi:hypothetical protein
VNVATGFRDFYVATGGFHPGRAFDICDKNIPGCHIGSQTAANADYPRITACRMDFHVTRNFVDFDVSRRRIYLNLAVLAAAFDRGRGNIYQGATPARSLYLDLYTAIFAGSPAGVFGCFDGEAIAIEFHADGLGRQATSFAITVWRDHHVDGFAIFSCYVDRT